MAGNVEPFKIFTKPKGKQVEKFAPLQVKERKRLTLKEMQEKVYPFPNSEVLSMLDKLLDLKLIELPEIKRPEEANKVNDPNYYKFQVWKRKLWLQIKPWLLYTTRLNSLKHYQL
ncbi:hypothetical protein Vadar_012188 [Vaccinium darrowii]|uniref:Uncharacterized protein n=1 Tax=Vaccinium darrowii TaxID=229202 RepID=A0ACB7Z3I3_9ERIC|nr:hypothetical protein Vadar_012188 [Vaccinium darrowii]